MSTETPPRAATEDDEYRCPDCLADEQDWCVDCGCDCGEKCDPAYGCRTQYDVELYRSEHGPDGEVRLPT